MRSVLSLWALVLGIFSLALPERCLAQQSVGKNGLKINGNLAQNGIERHFPEANRQLISQKHMVNLQAGKKYRVTLNSTEQDSFLIIADKNGKQLAFDDDSGGNLNSLINIEVPADGPYKVYACALGGRAGNYELKIVDLNADGASDQPKSQPPVFTVVEEEDLDGRPTVYRAGKLPPGLPPWFQQLDTDRDGQVSLWEWRKAGKSLEEFFEWDLNEDGFITAEEVLKKNQMSARPAPPIAQKTKSK